MADQLKNNVEKSTRGGKRPGAGRPPGVPNKATREFRETVRMLLEENAENVRLWLSKVAMGYGRGKTRVAPDPGRALRLLTDLAEFAAPKLSRSEVTGKDGSPLIPERRIADEELAERTMRELTLGGLTEDEAFAAVASLIGAKKAAEVLGGRTLGQSTH